ncbi:MAG: hypothetical protein LBV75_07570 [Paludibacter sp.]|jgi:hypothetical protein|nr:hypothetical protein [Paludibacter sp.]
MEFLSSINNVWAFAAFVIIYFSTEILKWHKKKQITAKKSERFQHDIEKKIARLETACKDILPAGSLMMGDEIRDNFKNLNERMDKNDVVTQRLQVLNLIQHTPLEVRIISKEYDKYKEMSGNSYLDEVFATWQQKQQNKLNNLKQNKITVNG